MSRPVGSKNKPRSQAAKEHLTAPVVEKIKRRGSPKETVTTTEVATAERDLSIGNVSVKPATSVSKTTDLCERVIHTVKGYVNVQRNPNGGYYLGGDIHNTVELAKSVASKPTIAQLFVAFEVKE
jgi:hypothetical protein